jgi:hypothetical protein
VTARAVWVISSLNPVVRIDYVGRHDSGAHSAAYIFYVYFSDSSGLKFERFVRVLRTADGTLHVLAA